MSRPTRTGPTGPSRRTLLQALGLSTGSLFLPSRGLAAAAPARRIVFFVTGHGTVYDNWKMRPGGQADDVDFEVDLTTLSQGEFSPILAPLHRHAGKLLVLDGLAHVGSIATAFNEHEEGHATCLTGSLPIPVDGSLGRPESASVDQLLAASATTPFRSLEYSVIGGWPVNFDDLGNAIPLESDPVAAWNRLFPAGTGGLDTTADRVARNQHRVLDLAKQRFDALAPRLSADDRIKLEAHRDLVGDLENQVLALQSIACEPIDQPTSSWPEPLDEMEAFQGLAVAALSCGLTDIVTIRGGQLSPETIGAPPGDLHADYAHQADFEPTAAGVMTDYHTWYAERFAELLDKLDAIPEGSGTMLDHTIVVWTNELSTGSHQHDDLPIVVAGGTTHFRSGRLIRYAPTSPVQGPWSVVDVGRPHNQLLTSLAQAMGSSRTSVGLTEVALSDGSMLDCTGTLDGLF